MQKVQFSVNKADGNNAEGNQNHRRNTEQGIQQKHDHQHRKNLHDVHGKGRQNVAEETVNRAGIGIDLRHQASGLPGGEESQRKPVDGRKNHAAQFAGHVCGESGGENGLQGADQHGKKPGA